MRWLLLMATACSFHHGSLAPGDAPGSEGDARLDAPRDAPRDAAVTPTCAVGVASATGTNRGRVGSATGGSENFPPLECLNPADRIVGLALRMSDQNTLFGGRSVHGIQIACAPVTITATGGTTGTVYQREILGNGGFDWSPSTQTPFTLCQPGWVVSGVSAHTSGSGNLFVDVSITCSHLDTVAAIIGTETIYVTGSLDEAAGNDAVNCNADEILVRLGSRNGAGIDSVELYCTTPTCL